MLVIGDVSNKFGKGLSAKFSHDTRIRFIGPLFNDVKKLHTLKVFSHLYFHGHSVGGTNPSLLEAMASRALIAAHRNPFNKTVLSENAYYFETATDVKYLVENINREHAEMTMIGNNLHKVQKEFSWEKIISEYENLLKSCVHHNYVLQ
jgi:glycosyltransferase involved in cell wall biosynthesis